MLHPSYYTPLNKYRLGKFIFITSSVNLLISLKCVGQPTNPQLHRLNIYFRYFLFCDYWDKWAICMVDSVMEMEQYNISVYISFLGFYRNSIGKNRKSRFLLSTVFILTKIVFNVFIFNKYY